MDVGLREAKSSCVVGLSTKLLKLLMLDDTDFIGKEECTVFVDIAVGYDVLLIKNELEILFADCTMDIDIELRKSLELDGYPAAMEVLRVANNIHQGSPLFDWIEKHMQNNPVDQEHESPGVTVDFGLHDFQLPHATMLATELNGGVRPPGTKHIRRATYFEHQEAFIKSFDGCDKQDILPGQARFGKTSKGNEEKGVMLPIPRMNSFPLRDDSVHITAAYLEGLCRASASDMSMRYFNSLPGICALEALQKALKWAEGNMRDAKQHCLFEGATEYLYPKGSISLQCEKNGMMMRMVLRV